jgi:5-(carboxyamino)imidazole ribonucleotide synthase
VLKTADFGYDGKGQLKLEGDVDVEKTWARFHSERGVLEQWIRFQAELSVVVARGLDGHMLAFPPAENLHRRHILDISIVPGRFPKAIAEGAIRLACDITASLDVVGLLAVEFFLTQDSRLLVNELAPRPHNSGHYTFDACVTSQFEQQLRAVCGLPLGSHIAKPGRDVEPSWTSLENEEPDWNVILPNRGPAPSLWKAGSPPRKKDGSCFGTRGSGRSSCFGRDFQEEARTVSSSR